jgi:hypothetical protein
MWIIKLKGKNVFRGESTLGYIENRSELSRVRSLLVEQYATEFADKEVVQKYDTYLEYPIINSDKDITLIVELIRKL